VEPRTRLQVGVVADGGGSHDRNRNQTPSSYRGWRWAGSGAGICGCRAGQSVDAMHNARRLGGANRVLHATLEDGCQPEADGARTAWRRTSGWCCARAAFRKRRTPCWRRSAGPRLRSQAVPGDAATPADGDHRGMRVPARLDLAVDGLPAQRPEGRPHAGSARQRSDGPATSRSRRFSSASRTTTRSTHSSCRWCAPNLSAHVGQADRG